MDFNLIFLFALNLNLISRFVLAQPFPFLIISLLLWLLIWFYAKRKRGNITNGTWSFPSHFLILFLPCKKGDKTLSISSVTYFCTSGNNQTGPGKGTHIIIIYIFAIVRNGKRLSGPIVAVLIAPAQCMHTHISMCVLTGYFAGVVSSRDFGCVLSVFSVYSFVVVFYVFFFFFSFTLLNRFVGLFIINVRINLDCCFFCCYRIGQCYYYF